MSDQDPSTSSHHACPHCGHELSVRGTVSSTLGAGRSRHSLQQAPSDKQSVHYSIGPYQVVNTIGKGGMGEVLLAYDTICNRYVALKKVRGDLEQREMLLSRFLEEATITSQLTHPAIIPIYSIHAEQDEIYYIMPYIQGRTLKEVLRTTRQQEKKGEELDHLGGSIQALMRVFLTVCQAVAYAHAQSVLHRDLKPENIIIGPYGEVMILDWGLAQMIEEAEEVRPSKKGADKPSTLTRMGKVVGTIHYMAPERALGKPATVQTDIYSLGVILYQILTLHHPFRRKSLDHFRKTMTRETYAEPSTVAPYREVPRVLSHIVDTCLQRNARLRYDSVETLIREIENYIEGRPEWFQIASLNIEDEEDWEFQENVLISQHTSSCWVHLMVSQQSFSHNVRLETRVKLGDTSPGVGLLICVPETSERIHLNDGYSIWLAAEGSDESALTRSSVEVLSSPELQLKRNVWHDITFEKLEDKVYVTVNGQLQLSYISHIPLLGTHVGLLTRDGDVDVAPLVVSVGSQSVSVSCLAVPDAFLSRKDYDQALTEYRRIGYAFPGRTEGREAMFRAGLTLLEQVKRIPKTERSENDFDEALAEFEKLHDTPGAPLGYLGKAHVYEVLGEYEEELKCYELAFRRYQLHPLLPVLQEHISFRLHHAIRQSRLAGYGLALLVQRHLPTVHRSRHASALFERMREQWETLPWIDEQAGKESTFSTALAFWLANGWALDEQLREDSDNLDIVAGNIVYSLIELGKDDEISRYLENFADHIPAGAKQLLSKASLPVKLKEAWEMWDDPPHQAWPFLTLCQQALDAGQGQLVLSSPLPPTERWKIKLDILTIWALLLEKRWQEAGELLHTYPDELLHHESNLLYFLYGCWLEANEGRQIAQIHFRSIIERRYPPSWTLAMHYLNGHLSVEGAWGEQSFVWERKQLWRQLALYAHCAGRDEEAKDYRAKVNNEVV